jgi:D-alanyl-D-alanine carboxypeptidase
MRDKDNNRWPKKYAAMILFPLTFLIISCSSLTGQTNVEFSGISNQSGISEDFQSILDSLQRQYGFPGATAAYVLPDGTVGTAATGLADMETGREMTHESRMLSASIGKTFVAATAILLSSDGILVLDDPVSEWMGQRNWFARLPNHESITLRQLLTHNSGLPDHVHLDSFANAVSKRWCDKDNPFTPEDLIGFVLDMPPVFEAGEGWGYTDTGYILAGLIIEEATGKSVYEHIADLFLKPLGLNMTSPSDSRFLTGLAAGYPAADNPFGLPSKTTTESGIMVWHPGFEWTGGGLVSNSRDLALWGWSLYGGRAMADSCLKELMISVPVSDESDDIRYGAGVAIYRNGSFGTVLGHGGWIPGYCSSLRYYSDYGVAIAFQINTDIDIMDGPANVIQEMELCLADIVIAGTKKIGRGKIIYNDPDNFNRCK